MYRRTKSSTGHHRVVDAHNAQVKQSYRSKLKVLNTDARLQTITARERAIHLHAHESQSCESLDAFSSTPRFFFALLQDG